MIWPGRVVTLAGAAAGLVAGIATEHLVVRRRRTEDPEAGQAFGVRRGQRAHYLVRPDGASIYVEETGPLRTRGVVFVHGSALRTDQWHYQLAGISDHRLVFYDLRGHGRSQPKGGAPFSVATLAEDLAAVIQDAGLDEVTLVGHSLGGMIALELCHEWPDLMRTRINSLVLCNTTYRPATETMIGGAAIARLERITRRPLDLVGSQHLRIDRWRKVVKPSDALFWAVSFAGFAPGASARQVDFTCDMLADTPSDVIFDLFKAYRDFDVRHALGGIGVPVLVVGGTHDHVTLPEASEYIAARLPQGKLKVFEGCGHMAMMERHHEFNAMLDLWIEHTSNTDRRGEARS